VRKGRTLRKAEDVETTTEEQGRAEAVFQRRPLHTINVGLVQDYMSWRRLCSGCSGEDCEVCDQTGQGVKQITLRHDLHALSPRLKYGINHNSCLVNPVDRVKIPSDPEAIRIHVRTPAEEVRYFDTCKDLAAELQRRTGTCQGGHGVGETACGSSLRYFARCRPCNVAPMAAALGGHKDPRRTRRRGPCWVADRS
jgi:hypothetical protein